MRNLRDVSSHRTGRGKWSDLVRLGGRLAEDKGQTQAGWHGCERQGAQEALLAEMSASAGKLALGSLSRHFFPEACHD